MDALKSKSQKKREADALQKIGVQLIGLSLEKLDRLPLSAHLRQAIVDAKVLKSHGAVRRQAQLIGKLMRADNSTEIVTAFEELLAEASAKTEQFHDVEMWRRRLMSEGNQALTDFIECHQPDDIQHFRQLIKKAISEENKGQHMGASKALFRYVRSCLK
jgi:ribosome-associated protein